MRKHTAFSRQHSILLLLLLFFGIGAAAVAQQAPATTKKVKDGKRAETRTPTQAPAPVVALKGGTLLTVSHGTIKDGVLVIENGKITAVGPASSVGIPKGAQVIDATGMTIYP